MRPQQNVLKFATICQFIKKTIIMCRRLPLTMCKGVQTMLNECHAQKFIRTKTNYC
uniref:Uncharacterized protein n=1 Tax=Pieris brassicae granulosis virus TaxID=10465 RepID=A0A7G9U8Q6_GVPB|nr:hypothetical protein [Pieris brassicae granulovirus]